MVATASDNLRQLIIPYNNSSYDFHSLSPSRSHAPRVRRDDLYRLSRRLRHRLGLRLPTNTLTLSGDNVDWSAIKAFSSTTEHVVFADDYTVSPIPDEAFKDFSKLTAIDIPDVVTSIEVSSFYNCTSLTSVSLPKGLTSLGHSAFGSCSSLGSISLPESLNSIGYYVFSGCTALTSINIPASLSSILWGAFEGCTSLTSVSLSKGVKRIDGEVFKGCTSLTSITLPASLTSIGARAFYGCTSLTSVEILSNGTPDNKHVVYLGDDLDASNETSTGYDDVFPRHQATLTYDPNTTWIGDDDTQNLRYYFNDSLSKGIGWSYDSSTNTLTLSGDNVDWTAIKAFSSTTENVVFAEDYAVNPIPDEAFEDFSKLTAIDIPDVVTSIEVSSFYNCTSLTSVSLPKGLTSLGHSALGSCSSLVSISLPESLNSIGYYVFSRCTALTSINIPASLSSILWGAFNGCTSLTSVSLSEGVKRIDGEVFKGCTSLTSITLPASLTSIGLEAFAGCTSLTSVEILSNGTSDNKHIIYLGDGEDMTSTGYDDVFPQHQATLIYDPATTWIGDNDSQNLRYYFNSFSTPTSIPTTDAPASAPQYYDLSGRPISPTIHKGIAVKLQDGHSSLITIK